MIDGIKLDKNFGIWCVNSTELDDIAYYICGYKYHGVRSSYYSGLGFIRQTEFIESYNTLGKFDVYYNQAKCIIRKQKLEKSCLSSEIK